MNNNTPADLASIYGDWNPEAHMQGRRQVEQNNQMQAQELEKSSLANIFSAQQNPQLLEQQRLSNDGMGFDNMSRGVKGRHDVATEGFKLDDAKRAQALAAPEHEIKMMATKAQQMAYDPDPAIQAKGKKLMQMSQAAIEARQKHADEMEKQELIRKSAERVAAGNNAASRYGADSRERLAASRSKITGPLEEQLAGAKGLQHRSNIYLGAAERAMKAGDDAAAAHYRAESLKALQEDIAARGAAAQVGSGDRPDLDALGIPTNKSRGYPIQEAPAVTQLPAGSKQIGTSGGKPVYQTPDGKKFIGE